VNFARGLPKTQVCVETLPSVEGRSYVSVKRREAQETIRRIFFPDHAVDVQIDVPDPDSVSRLNGEYRRRASRRSARTEAESAAGAEPSPEKPPAPGPEGGDGGMSGDGISGTTTPPEGAESPPGPTGGQSAQDGQQ
jgi:hypothetical protein